jgi:hypothetical protein
VHPTTGTVTDSHRLFLAGLTGAPSSKVQFLHEMYGEADAWNRNANIAKQGAEALEAFGGAARLAACAN